jgi:hypothetical protein
VSGDSPRLRIWFRITLSTIDLFVSIFLIFGGGMIAGIRSPTVGYVTVGFGLFLIYLSTGMWTKQKWKLIIRFVLYAGTFAVLALITAIGLVERRFSSDDVFLCLLAAGFLVVILLSAAHFRTIGQPNTDRSW